MNRIGYEQDSCAVCCERQRRTRFCRGCEARIGLRRALRALGEHGWQSVIPPLLRHDEDIFSGDRHILLKETELERALPCRVDFHLDPRISWEGGFNPGPPSEGVSGVSGSFIAGPTGGAINIYLPAVKELWRALNLVDHLELDQVLLAVLVHEQAHTASVLSIAGKLLHEWPCSRWFPFVDLWSYGQEDFAYSEEALLADNLGNLVKRHLGHGGLRDSAWFDRHRRTRLAWKQLNADLNLGGQIET